MVNQTGPAMRRMAVAVLVAAGCCPAAGAAETVPSDTVPAASKPGKAFVARPTRSLADLPALPAAGGWSIPTAACS